jgi:hypothetical protein
VVRAFLHGGEATISRQRPQGRLAAEQDKKVKERRNVFAVRM